MSTSIIIDQRTDDTSVALAARKLWKALYKLSDAHTWKDLDSFLCDYDIFKNEIEKAYKNEHFVHSFYWSYDPDGRIANTYVYNYDPEEDYCYKITIDRNPHARKIVIENSGKL